MYGITRVASMLDPANAAANTNAVGYPNAIDAARPLVRPELAADPAVSADVLEAQVKRLAPPVQVLQSKPYEPAAGAPSPSAPVGTPPAVALSNYDRALFAAAGIPTAEHEKVKQQGAAAVARLQERR